MDLIAEVQARLEAHFEKVLLFPMPNQHGIFYRIWKNGNEYTSSFYIPSNYKELSYDYIGVLIDEVNNAADDYEKAPK